MNWESLKGDWKVLKGQARQKWAKLTDDDLELIAGKGEELAGRLQVRYGLQKDEAERQASEWMKTVNKR